MKFEPYPYQQDGINWVLSHRSAGLFLPPGLGKTAIMLNTISILKQANEIDCVIIIAPLRVCHMVWPYEIRKWDNFNDLTIGILHGADKDKVVKRNYDIYILNPEGLNWFTKYLSLFKGNKVMLICDESTLFKTYNSLRFKTLKKMLSLFTRRVILTGTPVPNGLLQLWSQIYILDMGKRLGKYITHYRSKYFYTSDYQGFKYDIIPGMEEQIYKAIGDIVLHKSHDEIKLPPLVINELLVELPEHARLLYKQMQDDMIAEYGSGDLLVAMNAASKSSKLKQITNGGFYTEDGDQIVVHTAKIDAAKELVQELNGRPLLIMYEYVHDLSRLQDSFPGAPYIGGGAKNVNSTIDAWNRGEIPIMFLQPQAGGHGLNLQDGGCRDILWASIPFDLEYYMQANARVYRQGVKNSVTIHHIVVNKSKDSDILKILKEKSELQNELLISLLK